jgi:hypothetical protein
LRDDIFSPESKERFKAHQQSFIFGDIIRGATEITTQLFYDHAFSSRITARQPAGPGLPRAAPSTIKRHSAEGSVMNLLCCAKSVWTIKDLKLADATGAHARNRSRAPRGTNNSTKGEKIFNALHRYSAV